MNTVLNFSMHTSSVPATIQNLRFTEIDSAVPARAAAALSVKGNYDFLVVKDQNAVAGIFFPGYVEKIFQTRGNDIFLSHNFPMKALPKKNASLDSIIAQIDKFNIDFHSELVNVHPNFWICDGGGSHIIYERHCDIHDMDGHK